ncbi:MAG: hypothetical protein ABFC24_13085 [Methanoregulaceae archaeon]
MRKAESSRVGTMAPVGENQGAGDAGFGSGFMRLAEEFSVIVSVVL